MRSLLPASPIYESGLGRAISHVLPVVVGFVCLLIFGPTNLSRLAGPPPPTPNHLALSTGQHPGPPDVVLQVDVRGGGRGGKGYLTLRLGDPPLTFVACRFRRLELEKDGGKRLAGWGYANGIGRTAFCLTTRPGRAAQEVDWSLEVGEPAQRKIEGSAKSP